MRSQKFKNTAFRAVSQKTIPELQDQLQRLKQKERTYLRLSKKVKELQQKSKTFKQAGEMIPDEVYENEQIQKLKAEIDKTIADSKRIEQDSKVIKDQVKSLENQLRVLDEAYSALANENKLKRQRIQLKDQQLVEKQNEFDSLVDKKNCNELVIEELRIQLSKLQGEEEELRRELEKIRMERQEQEKHKEKLRDTVDQLKRQIDQQEANSRDYKYRLSQVKEGNNILKEELITLINLQQKLKQQLEKATESYHSVTSLAQKSKHKLQLLQDELKIAEEDVRLLSDEYIRESQQLREQELQNQQLNTDIDRMAKQIFEVWESVKEVMEMSSNKNGELKIKAYQVWNQIAQILDLK